MKTRVGESSASFRRSIRDAVDLYKFEHKEEYRLVKEAIRMRRSLLKDPKYGQILDGADGRALSEYPDTLHAMIVAALSDEGLTWWKSKEGGRWFAQTYPEFALAENI
jgi:hypothetical protein